VDSVIPGRELVYMLAAFEVFVGRNRKFICRYEKYTALGAANVRTATFQVSGLAGGLPLSDAYITWANQLQ
jgi:hypothetical protein